MQRQSTKKFPEGTTFGERLASVRRYLGLTMADFAGRLGYNKSYISRLERGISKRPSPKFIQSVCTTWLVSRGWMETGDGDPFLEETLAALFPEDGSKLNRDKGRYLVWRVDALLNRIGAHEVLPLILRDIKEARIVDLITQVQAAPNLSALARAAWCRLLARCATMRKEDASKGFVPLRELGAVKSSQHELTSVGADGNYESMFASPTKLKSLMARLDRAAKQKGFTQSRLADDLEISRQAVNRWFKKGIMPGGEVALRLDAWLKARGID